MVVTVRRDRAMAETMPRRSPPTRVMSEAAMATSAPVPIATPTAASDRAPASLMPSPQKATTEPCACSSRTVAALSAGRLGQDMLDADLLGDRGGGRGVV